MTNKVLSAPRWASYSLASLGIAALTGVLIPLRALINSTTIGFAFLLVVVAVAIIWDSGLALLASVLGMLCYNFFFLPPDYAFTIADPQNCVALTAFSLLHSLRVSFQPEQSDALILTGEQPLDLLSWPTIGTLRRTKAKS